MHLLTDLAHSKSAQMLPGWYGGGFKSPGPSISVLKSAMQKAFRQYTNGEDVATDKGCKYLALQCFVAVSALITNMLSLKRVTDAKSLYTNMWNRLIVMTIDEDTVDINAALCLCAILKEYEKDLPSVDSVDEKNQWLFAPVEYVHAMYKAWHCLAKTHKHRVTSHISPLFKEADYTLNPSYRTLASELLHSDYDAVDVTSAFEEGDFLKFIAAMMRYDKSHFLLDGKKSEKKKAKDRWIDDLFIKKFNMGEAEAEAIRYLYTRRDENDRMRLHVAIMLFYRRHNLLRDQVECYRDLLAFVDKKKFSEENLCKILESLFEKGLDVDGVAFVYDQHTGKTIRNPEGEELTFAEAGAMVNHMARLPAPREVMNRLENAYIERSRENKKASGPSKGPSKKRKAAGQEEDQEEDEALKWAKRMIATLKSRLEKNVKEGNERVMHGMLSPAVEGSRVSDQVSGKEGLSPQFIKELLLVLIYRRLIGTMDTNLFNLMFLGMGRVLSVDENPMTKPISVTYPTLPEGEEGPAAAPFAKWLQTAQKINGKVVSQLVSFARENRSIVRDFLQSFQALYPHFRECLQATFNPSQREALEQVHREAYAAFEVAPEVEPEVVPPQTTEQAEWDDWVDSNVVGPDEILAQSRLCLSSAVNHGFKNIAMVTTIQEKGKADDTEEGLLGGEKVFLKVGEPHSSGLYSRASAELRQRLGLASVPVAILRVRITDPEGFGPPADRGEQIHRAGRKTNKKARAS